MYSLSYSVMCCVEQFDEAEKVRMKKETLRLETKQTRQMSELRSKNEAIVKELEEVYVSACTNSAKTCLFSC